MTSRIPSRLLTALGVLGAFVALSLIAGNSAPVATAATTAVLNFPNASCGATPSVAFTWQPADGALEVWLDIATEDNGFAPGTFTGAGPFGGTTSSYTLTNLKADKPYLARVNSRTATGWQASPAVAFVPCGAPQLLNYSSSCQGEAATASFRWAPASPMAVSQVVEAGTDQVFATEYTRSSSTLLPLVERYDMSGLRANVNNFLRITATLPDGTTKRSFIQTFTTPCAGAFSRTVSDELVHTSDTLVYSRLNIKAPVNTRKVGYDGAMGVPEGKDDVVMYDFSVYKGLGGSPGQGGTSIIAGHLDYHPNFQAVFWDLAKAREGDIIDYYRADGSKYSYRVVWASLIPSDESLNPYFVSTSPETMILITCEGDFDRVLQNYDKRALVYAVAVN